MSLLCAGLLQVLWQRGLSDWTGPLLFSALFQAALRAGLLPADPLRDLVLLLQSCMPSAQNSVLALQAEGLPRPDLGWISARSRLDLGWLLASSRLALGRPLCWRCRWTAAPSAQRGWRECCWRST